MTVSTPKPNWRLLQEHATTALTARVTALKSRGQSGSADSVRAQEWSAVMTGPSRATEAKARRMARAAAKADPTPIAAREARGEITTAWVLPGLVLVLCLTSVGWFFAHGTAAAIWLAALIGLAFVGAPLVLLTLRLLRYEDRE